MTDSTSGTDVTVTVEAEAPETVENQDDSPTVVVVEDSGSDSPDVALLVGALAARVDALEQRLSETAVEVEEAADTADAALDVALDTAVEPEPAPAPEPDHVEPEPDDEPEPVHTWHKRNPFKGND